MDHQGFVWVAGTAAQDSILKFTKDGKLVWDFDHRPPKGGPTPPENNQQTDTLVSKGRFNLDEDAREIYIINWKRVLVYDMDTARAVVIELLIDDGNPTRGHRANIFNPSYKLAGLSVGEASTFGSRCVIDYVGGFREGSADDSQPGSHRRTRNSPRD